MKQTRIRGFVRARASRPGWGASITLAVALAMAQAQVAQAQIAQAQIAQAQIAQAQIPVAAAPISPAAPAEAASAAAPEPRLYAVEVRTGATWDRAKPAHEQAFFSDHSAHLRRLRGAGHIVLGARYGDKGLLVFSARAAADVKALMEQDPSMKAGTFSYELHDFNVFYPGTLQARPRR
jgi:hypothetical protein